MQLTAQDKRAARDGFAYVVVRGGQRVCYTTTLGEAKRECGKSGKVVSISGMRYTAKNPSSGAKQRARGTRSYGKGLFVEADLSGRHARMLDKAAGIRRKSAKLGPTYTKLMHRDALAEAARVRNPSGFPVSSPSVKTLTTELGISVEDAKKIKELAAVGKPMSALRHADKAMGGVGGGSFGVESLYPDFPNFYYVNTGDSYNTTLYYNGKSLRVGDWGSYVESKSRNPRHRYGRR